MRFLAGCKLVLCPGSDIDLLCNIHDAYPKRPFDPLWLLNRFQQGRVLKSPRNGKLLRTTDSLFLMSHDERLIGEAEIRNGNNI